MIRINTFKKNMEKDPRYVFYVVATTLEAIAEAIPLIHDTVGHLDDIGRRLYPGYSWIEIENMFYGPLFPTHKEVPSEYTLTLFNEPTPEAAIQAASIYTHWTFELGYISEATAIKQGLLKYNFWSPPKEEC
jgi:hypothetical protein